MLKLPSSSGRRGLLKRGRRKWLFQRDFLLPLLLLLAFFQLSNLQCEARVLTSVHICNRQTHCSEARIFPDSICDPIWNGPILEGTVNCQNDSVFFFLENRPMAVRRSDLILHCRCESVINISKTEKVPVISL